MARCKCNYRIAASALAVLTVVVLVIGVHTPEFAFEKDRGNVERPVSDLGSLTR